MLLGSHAMTFNHPIIVFLDRLLSVLNHVILPNVCLTSCISLNVTHSKHQTFCCGEYVVDFNPFKLLLFLQTNCKLENSIYVMI